MLICKDIAYVRNQSTGDLIEQREYDRVFLNYGPLDEVIEREKSFTNKKGEKVVLGMVTVPKEDKSKHDENELFAQSVAYFKDTLGKQEPMRALLDYLDYGANLKTRPVLSAKVVDVDKAYETSAKRLMATKPGKFASLADAIAAVRALME